MRTFPLLLSLSFLFFLVVHIQSKMIYNTKKSYITPITKLNFEGQITKIRQSTKYVAIVQYFKYEGTIF